MDSDEEDIALLSHISTFLIYRRWKRKYKKKENKRKWWIKPWLANRNELGAYNTLIKEMKNEDHDSFMNFFSHVPDFIRKIRNSFG